MISRIALFIPCYNEEKRIKLDSFLKFIKENDYKIDFYFINDGSDDETNTLITNTLLVLQNVFLITLYENHGKGNALRAGILQNVKKPYKYIGFIDADLDIPLNQVLRLFDILEKNSTATIAISYRSFLQENGIFNLRCLASIVVKFTANQLLSFKPPLKDTQCGCKLFKSEIASKLFEEKFISEWLFDIELFFRLKINQGLEARDTISEVAVLNLQKSKMSKIKTIQGLKIIKQFYRIYEYYQ